MTKRDRHHGGRERGTRKPVPRVLIVVGGRTEHDYFEALIRRHGRGPRRFRLRHHPGAPSNSVSYATRASRQDSDGSDQIWCVVDVDEFDIEAADRAARAAGVELAVSNPCFEVWLLLHHEDRTAAFGDAKEALTALRRHLPEFDKGRLRFDHFASGVHTACVRARALDGNPSSGVWRLVEHMEVPG